MSVRSIGSSGTANSAHAALQRAKQKLAADVANKATDQVITVDRAAVAKSLIAVNQRRPTNNAVDLNL